MKSPFPRRGQAECSFYFHRIPLAFFLRFVVPILVVGMVLSACDQAPGVSDAHGVPPVLSHFTFSPSEFGIPHDADGPELTIPLSLEVQAQDADGDLSRVFFVVMDVGNAHAIIAEGSLSRMAGSRFGASVDVTISRGAVGVYVVLVYAVDMREALSNEVRGRVRVRGVGEPPVIESLDVPETIERPDEGAPNEQIPLRCRRIRSGWAFQHPMGGVLERDDPVEAVRDAGRRGAWR